MKKLFEDDPRGEEYDKYGRYLPKSAELVRQSTSSLSFVKDSYKNDPNKKEERKRRIIARMNCDEYELNGHIFKKGLTSSDKKAIIRKNNLAIKRKRGL